MEKREFLKSLSLAVAGLSLFPVQGMQAGNSGFALPSLPYAAGALEPWIDKQTMEIHHGKHHKAYVDKLNEAVVSGGLSGLTLEQLLQQHAGSNVAIRNHGGGHYNHSLFWQWLSPKTGLVPGEATMGKLNAAFGSLISFKEKFTAEAMGRFGSGWAWLCLDQKGNLFISNTANQDNPLMSITGISTGTPVLGLDVWEHAYYLKYQNKRKDYVDAFWNVVNWEKVEELIRKA
jgi:Fe-Mn family superoxide dismutase